MQKAFRNKVLKDIALDYVTTLKVTREIYLVSTLLGMLSNVPGLIFVMAQVIFSPLSWEEGMAMRRNALLPRCEAARKGKKL